LYSQDDLLFQEAHGDYIRMKMHQVIFQPSGRRGEISDGRTIIEASRELGVGIESDCGEARTCGKCKVKLEQGFFETYGITSLPQNLSPFTEEEEKFIDERDRNAGYRLSCAAKIMGDVLIFVPEESRAVKQVVRKAATERTIELKPAVSLHYVELSPPTLYDTLGDFERLKKALSDRADLPSLDIDYPVLLKLPDVLRKENWKVTVAIWMGKEIINIFFGHSACQGSGRERNCQR
jgi:uncharacterized 2Fe-2S/4Fe-4S cluster protein (DUF4445 family)